ncbi:sulfatase-like hydrolase/transferase [Streptomyces sp. NPDC087849]|uniref:sulfatase-like hydrolase/transferase n=1 Tax=Streptomyces sp. NPDC087849 TaxID=3365808 RepID=UPI0038077E13
MRIIYVDVGTLRADHTTPYGYHRPTTPNLQKLADKSVVFDRYYCSDSPCLPSRTALTSGRFGITNGVIGHFGPAAQFRLDAGHGPEPDRPLLGQHLGFGGYCTAAVSVFAERHRAYFFHANSASPSVPPTAWATKRRTTSTAPRSTGCAGTPTATTGICT